MAVEEVGEPDLDRLEAAVGRLRRNPAESADARALAAEVGVGVSELHGLVQRQYHSTTTKLIGQARAAAAVGRLVAGGRAGRSLGDVAAEVGYPSAGGLERAVRRHTGLAAEEVRRLREGVGRGISMRLPRGYAAGAVLGYLGRDRESVAERVRGGRVEVAVRLAGRPAVVEMRLGRGRAEVRVRAAHRLPARAGVEALGMARRLLGLTGDPGEFERRVGRDRRLAGLIAGRRGWRIPRTRDPFDCLLWAIVGQQVNLRFAFKLRRVLFALAGEPAGGGLVAPPTPEAVAGLDAADLLRRQFSRGKAEYVLGIADAVATGALPVEEMTGWPATRIERALLARRGLGPWSTHYVMMRGFGLEDCVPVGDSGLNRGLVRFFGLAAPPGRDETLRLMEPFRPYRSYATHHLWALSGSQESPAEDE